MQTPRETIALSQGQSFRLLRWSRSVNRVEAVLAPGRTVSVNGHGDHWHYHAETELTFIQRGAGTRFVADQIGLFESADLVLIGSNVPHYWHLRGPSAGLSLQWHFPLEHGIWSFAEAAGLARLEEAAKRGLHLRGETAREVGHLLEQMQQSDGLERLSVFLRLLAALTRASGPEMRPLSAQPFSLSGTARQQDAVRRAVSYILANYTGRIQLAEVLRLTGMSRATFARQFKRHAGKSFSNFLSHVRLQAVCRKLLETEPSVSEIAFACGFNQLSFFNRLFRRQFGLTPSAYRRRNHAAKTHQRITPRPA